MKYKDDWAACQARFDAFWSGGPTDRCLVAVTAPRQTPLPSDLSFQAYGSLEDRWMNADRIFHNLLAGCGQVFLGGESFPNFFPNLGPGVVAGFMGSPFRLAEDTVWFDRDPILRDWDRMPPIQLDRESLPWTVIRRMTEQWVSRSGGDFCVALPDLGGTLDILASLRGTENLLTDFLDRPDDVLALVEDVDRIWLQCYRELQALLSPHQEGTTAWLPLWCRGRYYPIQCDLSAMISPDHFLQFALPSLERQAAFLDRSIYHLDGPGQLVHLDHLLAMDRLTGIQWVPGAGAPDEMDPAWYPLYRKIQAAGKLLVLSCRDPRRIEPLLDAISPAGLYVATSCGTEAEARDLLDQVARWSETALRRIEC